jgi:hypothetical protein
MLTACASGTTPTQAPLLRTDATPQVAAALMEPCPPLPSAEDGKLGTLLKNHTEVALAYKACAQGKDDLSNAVRTQPGISVK